jgi:hypothetical protein
LVVGVLVLGTSGFGHAQQPDLVDPLLDQMTGTWVLTGTIGKATTTHSVRADWVLNHQFLQIHETSRDYEALVLIGWDLPHNRYIAYWMDVFGGGFSLRGYAPKAGSSIPIVFESTDGRFFTTFDYDKATDTWRWTLDNERNGRREPFARLSMTRERQAR